VPFSPALAERVRHALRDCRGIVEKKMFGGLVFLLHGKMLVGIWNQSLTVRLGPERAAVALKQPHVRQFDVAARPMRGWIMVDPDGLDSENQLTEWVETAMRFVETLPAKQR
jgi:TfoX/Sxy family transcriptional regulator of competence genes